MHGKAVKKPVEVGFWQWDGTAVTARLIDEWARSTAPYSAMVQWFFPISTAESIRDHKSADYTAEVWDYLHDKWIPLRTWDYVMKGVENECYACAGRVFDKTYDITSKDV